MAKTAEKPKPTPEPEQTANLPAVIDYGADAGGGLDNISREELAIPFFTILQTNSPQVDPNEAAYIKGAAAGDFINLGTGEIFKSLEMVPAHRDHNFVEKVPRTQGGGFVAIHAKDSDMVVALKEKQSRFGKLTTPAGTEIQETFYLYGLFREPDGVWQKAVIRFKSTQIKFYQTFMGLVASIEYPNKEGKMIQPALWAHRWKVTTRPDSNKKGKFFSISITPAEERVAGKYPLIKSRLAPDDPVYLQGKEFYDLIKAGRVSVKHDDGNTDNTDGDEIPM